MSTWWCEYAQLPDGLHKGVRLTVDDAIAALGADLADVTDLA